ncbi:sulfurtransferase [Granulicella sp. 5B5]|uniref:rhodanese-like domain-containing protein n=1 Tax=Granulicella sp. 5B5 TaxID=1617967 RepID=UPI0015F7366B|nr:rhodanese-like domain-containing protein [Granulicella sp. 5B5]QMV18522.1 sulfurtransferase [Granulicella sp. 5B5]
MDLLQVIEHHGYAVTAIAFFAGSCGLPVPLSVVLLTAGAAAHGGSLNFWLVLASAFAAALFGDTLMFFGGRYTGWWLLAGLCQISMNPDVCIFSSAHTFHKRGPETLLIAKFIPGLGTVAAPLAGSLNMRLPRFLRLDSLGVLFYVTVWSSTGFLFASLLRNVVRGVEQLGHVAATIFILALAAYVCWLTVRSMRDSRYASVNKVAAQELLERMEMLHQAAHDSLVVIADVRSHGYYDPGMQRIKNSIRVEPNRLHEELVALREFMAPECEIYLYCSCAREATSVRVAKMLEQESCSTKVIRGGLKAWIKAGGPTEPIPLSEIEHLPRFE